MTKKLLINYFFPPQVGGIENYYLNLCKRMDPQEIVVLTHINYQSEVFDSGQDYKIYRTDFFGGKFSPRWRQMEKIIKEIIIKEGIEKIIFGHFHPFCMLGMKLNLPYYVFSHGTDITQIKNNWWQKRALRKVYQHYNCLKFILNSKFLAEQLTALLKGDSSKNEIIYPGIDYTSLSSRSVDFASKKELLGINENDIVLLSLGRVEPEKNFEAIIKLMPKLLSRFPSLKYLIVGEGSDLERLKALAISYGLKHKVIFTGAVDSDSVIKSFYYQLAHIFIVTSLKPEGFGIAYLEASSAKNAVIASKFGGSAEAVKDGETGILVDPFKSEEIETALVKLITDQQLWEKMSLAGVQWAETFDWKYQLEKIRKITG
jgi:phosphatidyl-myo-inositol dimannoside synthase